MIPISVRALETLGLGELSPGSTSDEITGFQIDSRLVRPGDLFVAIRGGRAFVDEARDRGATTLVPNDEFAAMAVVGEVLRASSSARFVGITGSTGKTSTKDILAALCAPVARTVATEGSYNAELGVPLTLGRLEPDTEICIVEMGMRGLGQITRALQDRAAGHRRDHRGRAGPSRARRIGRRRRAVEGGARGRTSRGWDRGRAGRRPSWSRICATTSTCAGSGRSMSSCATTAPTSRSAAAASASHSPPATRRRTRSRR